MNSAPFCLSLIVVCLLTSTACQPDVVEVSPTMVEATATSAATATLTPIPPTPTPTPLPSIAAPLPPTGGMATIYGRVLMQGQPYAGLTLVLSGSSSGENSRYIREEAVSGEDGVFLIADVPPGENYTLRADVEESGLTGEATAQEQTLSVGPDENLSVGEFPLLATDLVLLEPERESIISGAMPVLRWEPYPGAASYHLELEPLYGMPTRMELDTTESSLALDEPLMACTYGWDVTAYDEDGFPLARTDAFFVDDSYAFNQRFDGIFRIENPELISCSIELVYPPLHGILTPAQGNAGFEWEPNPHAEYYVLHIIRRIEADGTLVYNRVYDGEVSVQADGTLEMTAVPYLTPGKYTWYVTAVREGVVFASSPTGQYQWSFTIR